MFFGDRTPRLSQGLDDVPPPRFLFARSVSGTDAYFMNVTSHNQIEMS